MWQHTWSHAAQIMLQPGALVPKSVIVEWGMPAGPEERRHMCYIGILITCSQRTAIVLPLAGTCSDSAAASSPRIRPANKAHSASAMSSRPARSALLIVVHSALQAGMMSLEHEPRGPLSHQLMRFAAHTVHTPAAATRNEQVVCRLRPARTVERVVCSTS